MLRGWTPAAAIGLAVAGAAWAETVDVKMLNKGEAGPMVFEPALVKLSPGDSIRFLAADKGHNAETIDGMLPEGATAFEGRLNEELTVTFDQPGLSGVRCKPHFAMGAVMVASVGANASVPNSFAKSRIPVHHGNVLAGL